MTFLHSQVSLSLLNFYFIMNCSWLGLPKWHSGKESACQCRRHKKHGFDPGSGGSLGKENGNPFQNSCLENSMDRGAWQVTVHRSQWVGHDWAIECTHTHTYTWLINNVMRVSSVQQNDSVAYIQASILFQTVRCLSLKMDGMNLACGLGLPCFVLQEGKVGFTIHLVTWACALDYILR